MRSQSDSPVRIYRYWVRPEYPNWPNLPVAVRQEIAAQRSLWNQLVTIFAERHSWQVFVDKARHLAKRSSTSRANGSLVLKQFFDAARRFFNKQAGPPQPKPATPQKIHFQHRFPGSGLFAPQLFDRPDGVFLSAIPAQAWDPSLSQRLRKRLARTNGTFQVRDAALPFHTILHRPLPDDARIKAATLVGQQTVQAGYHHNRNSTQNGHPTSARWTWALHLTLELPRPDITLQTKPTAVLHLGGRFSINTGMPDLQIATLTDSTGHQERLCLPTTIFHAWRHTQTLSQHIQHCLAQAQEQLRRLPPGVMPLAKQSLFSHFIRTSRPKLDRLLPLLEAVHWPSTENDSAILQRVADRSTRLLREAHGLEQRYRGHRTWVYRNLALQLCQRYQQILVEESQTNQWTKTKRHSQEDRTAAGSYHDLLATPHFVGYLSEAAAKTGTQIHHRRPRSC